MLRAAPARFFKPNPIPNVLQAVEAATGASSSRVVEDSTITADHRTSTSVADDDSLSTPQYARRLSHPVTFFEQNLENLFEQNLENGLLLITDKQKSHKYKQVKQKLLEQKRLANSEERKKKKEIEVLKEMELKRAEESERQRKKREKAAKRRKGKV